MVSVNVTNTLVIPEASKVSPYNDDFDETSNFYKILFRPGYAVQARELTQIQTLGQIQVERLGRHIFKNGSIVIGGQLSYDKAISINLNPQYANTDIDVDEFIGKEIIFASGNATVRAEVITGQNSINDDPPTLMIKYLSGDEFGPDSSIKVSGEEVYANVVSSNVSANGLTASISDGIFFINGYFVRNGRQTIPVSKYSLTSNAKVGLEYTDAIVTENDNTILLDPALESSNYQAPGATRFKIDLTLAKRTVDSVDDEKFIELSRLENGVQSKSIRIPIYSELEETFARRTYDESGNYTVRPFRLEMKDDPNNSANLIARLDAGKAYVFGYEFETIAPEELIIERTRDTEIDELYDISTAFGHYVVAKDVQGFIDISTMPVADLHCVPWDKVINTNTATYGATKIGTTRVRSILYSSSANSANGQTHEVKAYIFDNRLSSITGNATGGGTNTIILNRPYISGNLDAYNRATLRLTAGNGNGDQKTIVSYNGMTKTATVDSNFSATPDANTQFSIDFTFKEVESIIVGTGGSTLTANLNISLESKDDVSSSGNTVISEPTFSSLVFKFPNEFIKDGLSINNYQYKKVFSNRSFTAGVGTITAGTGEALIGTGNLSDSIKLNHYLAIVKDPDTSGFVAGQIVSFTGARTISVAGSTATLDADIAGDFTADVIASVEIDSGTPSNPKIKTLVSANTSHITTAVSNGSFVAGTTNTTVYLTTGQVHIQNPNKVPSVAETLLISDVKELKKVYDLNGATLTPGTALSGFTDVTSRFLFDNGQKDTFYDHASIILRSGVSAPKGPLVACVDFYNHEAGTSDGSGYFSVDSYPDSDQTSGYSQIPYYTTNSGEKIRLSDAIDFRPKRQNAANASPNFTLQGIRIPTPNEEYVVTYEHYLGRKDLLVLSRDRSFKHLKGISSQAPVPPNDPDDGMILYRLDLPPFVLYPSNVVVRYVENKRYTMRDIGKLEQRIQNMEYYNTLNTLEKDATDLVIRDVNGLERTKYGIIADRFVGHQIGDVTNPDYRCSMDFIKGELRPFFKTTSHALEFLSGDANHARNGSTVTLDYDEVDFVVQNTASKAENVQPYLIAKFIGVLDLVPDNDIWVDTNRRPDVIVNLSGANDAWDQLAATLNEDVFGTEWNAWETHWTGSSTSRTTNTRQTSSERITTTTTTTRRTGTETREGLETTLNFDSITENLGDRVVDVSIIPFIRSKELLFSGNNLRPTRQVFYYFDEVPVTNYVQKPNVIKIANGNKFIDSAGYYERISSGANNASVLLSRIDTDGNTILYLGRTNGYFEIGQTITGALSGNTGVITSVEHYSGNATGGSTSTITLAQGAALTANHYSGNTIYLTAGVGIGQNSSIASYNAVTRVATVSPAFTVAPTTNTKYSIGIHKTTRDGSIAGNFIIPSNDNLSFRTGERVFRIIDNNINDLDNVTTRGEAKYNAQGLVQSKESLSVSVAVPVITVNEISETRPVTQTTTSTQRRVQRLPSPPVDPLAQTFFIEASEHPNGVFLSSVDLFFKSKDDVLPVWVEIRPTVNGYPHSSIIIPFSRKTLQPDQVNISDNPSAGNTATKTTFTFNNPVYLEPGKEYALVCQTNSLNYEAYVSEMGKKQLGTDRTISEQPHMGSLFKSQNASTWTPFQFEDLMFVLKKCDFTLSPSTIYFNNVKPTANGLMDWMTVQTNSLILANTDVQYAFKGVNISDMSTDSAFKGFNTDANYRHNQRKIIHNISDGSLNVRAILSTTNKDVSPVLDLSRYNVLAIQNIINNANISNTNIVLTNDGAGYTGTNIAITISGTSSETANAYVATVANGNVTSIIVDTPGAGYLANANVSFSGGNGSGLAGVINTELDPKGGTGLSKYITRKVILNEGFDAGDLRVFLTAYKPVGTDFAVYYKIKNSEDPEKFENRPYVRMPQYTPSNRYSTSQFFEDDYIEFEFRPSLTSNKITYTNGQTTFDTFSEFAIKIVLLSDNTIVVPVIKDMRAVALPGMNE